MNPADKFALCMRLAKLEGRISIGKTQVMSLRNKWEPVEIIITDPAETVRMLEALVKQYKDVSFSTWPDGILVECFDWGEEDAVLCIEKGGDTLPESVALAYEAMLIAQKEAKDA